MVHHMLVLVPKGERMNYFRSWKQILLLGVCAAGSTFVGAVVFGQTAAQPPDKKEVNKPKVAVKTLNIAQTQLVPQNPKTAVPKNDRKPYTLADLSKKLGKDLTPDTPVTPPNGKKAVPAKDVVVAMAKYEDLLNEHGYSFLDPPPPGAVTLPKGGITLTFKKAQDPKALAKQREVIATAHHKAPADKEKAANAVIARFSKANLPGELKTAKANEALIEKNHQAFLAEMNNLDPKKLTAAEKKAYDHVEGLIKASSTAPAAAKTDKQTLIASTIAAEGKQAAAVVNKTVFANKNLQSLLHAWFANTTQFDKVFSWNPHFGSTDTAEVHIDGNFELHAGMGLSSSSLSTKGSLKIGGSVLSDAFTVLDVEGSVSSSKVGSTTTSQLQVSAKLFGTDIFSPVNDSTTTESKSVDHDYPFDVTFAKGSITIVFVPVSFDFGLKGDLHVTSNDVLSPTLVSSNSTVTFNSSLYGTVAVDLEFASAGLTGSLTLASDTLQVLGSAGISTGKGPVAGLIPPHIECDFSVHDQLTLLSGELDLFVDVFGGRVGTLKLIGFGGFTPVNGYLVGPDHIVVPPPLAVSAK
jgi:hypothetical protein